jgi:hypothetical protein
MKRLIQILIAFAVIAVVLNDGGRYAQGIIDLRNSTGAVLDQGALMGRTASQAQIADRLSQEAAAQGITVTQFATTPSTVHIWTSEPVPGTWVVGPYVALTHGVPFARAFATPLMITYDAEESLK